MKVIILTGGSGVRLWPLSKDSFPKQFLHFGDGESLLQKTLKRIEKYPGVEEIVLSTNGSYAHLVKLQIEKLGLLNRCHILIEPQQKNTAPAIALAVKYLEEKIGTKANESILVLPSDHFISPENQFHEYLKNGESAAKNRHIVLFGVRPHKPETGYGYISLGPLLQKGMHAVSKFCEKPDLKTATEYFLTKNFLWNAGIFIFTPETFWNEMGKHAPEIYRASENGLDSFLMHFQYLSNISIDYALMEKSQNVVVCPMNLAWSDVGSWDNVYEIMEKDQYRNVTIGNVVGIDTEDSLIIGGKKLISTIGLKDMLIVETDEAIFIAQKGHSQKVKALIAKLKERAEKTAF